MQMYFFAHVLCITSWYCICHSTQVTRILTGNHSMNTRPSERQMQFPLLSDMLFPGVVKTLELFCLRGHQIAGLYKMYHRDLLCHPRKTVDFHRYHKGNRSSWFFEKISSLQLLNDLKKVSFAVQQSLNKLKSPEASCSRQIF